MFWHEQPGKDRGGVFEVFIYRQSFKRELEHSTFFPFSAQPHHRKILFFRYLLDTYTLLDEFLSQKTAVSTTSITLRDP